MSTYSRTRHHAPYDQAGICYERRIYKNWFAGIGATEWLPAMPAGIPQQPRMVAEPNPNWTVNALEMRMGYKMADAYVFYKWNVRGRHVVYGGIGASYCRDRMLT